MSVIAVRGIRLRIHPAFVLMLCVGIAAGDSLRMILIAASLFLHEAMHMLCARLMKVNIMELELMPFGGAARLENVWTLRPGQILPVALAGPITNGVIACLALKLVEMSAVNPRIALNLFLDNAVLCLFNLIPALPLDGGRLLFGMLSGKLGSGCSVRIGVWAGRVFALMLLVFAGIVGVKYGKIHLTCMMCAAFLLCSGTRETMLADGAAIISLVDRKNELEKERLLPIRWLAVSEDMILSAVISQLRPRNMHRIAVYDQKMRLIGVVEETGLLLAALDNANAAVGSVLSSKNDQPKTACI